MAKEKDGKIGKVLAVTAGVTLAVGASYCASCAFIFSKVFKRKKGPEYLTFSNSVPNKTINDNWFENASKENVVIKSFDGLDLHGTVVNNVKSNKWVIVVHGYSMTGTQLLDIPKSFHDRGYNCLIIDSRAHGMSEGSYSTLGWKEHYDLIDWIDFVINKDANAQIVLHGMSMGASTVLNTTGEFLPENVKCAVSDCAFSSIENLLKYQIKQYLKVPLGVLIPGVNFLCKSKANFSLYEGNSIRQVKQSMTPTLFIHGELDSFVPFEMVFDLFYACEAEKDLFSFPHSKHAEAFLNKNYSSKMFEFIERFVK